jgi:hypothetical protein
MPAPTWEPEIDPDDDTDQPDADDTGPMQIPATDPDEQDRPFKPVPPVR